MRKIESRADGARRRAIAFREVLYLSVWFGVLTGLGQAALRAVLAFGFGKQVLPTPHVVWLAPVADAALLSMIGIAVWLAVGRLRRVDPFPLLAGALVVPAVLGLLLLYPRLHWAAALVLAAGLAVQTARLVGRRPDGFARLVRRTLAPLAALAVLSGVLVAGSRAWAERRAVAALPAARSGAPNVVLLILDTVRAASLSLYGYERPTTPNLERLAEEGVVFEHAFATAPWTLPSHASMFTGRWPHELSADWRTPLDGTHPTLAEVLARQGYLTAGFNANLGYGNREYGLDRGFAHYEDYPLSIARTVNASMLTRTLAVRVRTFFGSRQPLARRSAADVNREFFDWLDGQRGDRPFFAFLNYFDAHSPYLPPPPYDTLFGPRKTQPDLSYQGGWTPEELQVEIDAYDGAIAYVDAQLGRLVAGLRRRGVLDETLIIVTSDHGEHFGEHGLLYHGNSLYLPLLRVPLVVTYPSEVPAAIRIDAPVSIVDIPATILDLAGASRARALPGASLDRYWADDSNAESDAGPIFARVSHATNMAEWLPASIGELNGAVLGHLHYIRTGDGAEELYDYLADPDELENLATPGRTPDALASLGSAVDSLLGTSTRLARRDD